MQHRVLVVKFGLMRTTHKMTAPGELFVTLNLLNVSFFYIQAFHE